MDGTYVYALSGIFALYCLLLAAAAVWDTCKFIIPNFITVGLIGLFVGTALYLPLEVDWLSHLGAGAVVFLGGAVLYRFNRLGGGDVKLLTAVACWAGFEHLLELMLYVTLGGGALALALLGVRRLVLGLRVARQGEAGGGSLPRVLLVGEAVPYAVAISPAAIALGTGLPHLGGYLPI